MTTIHSNLRRRKVLVLGDDERMLLPIARSLGRRGIQVHTAWCDSTNAALRSRFVTRFHDIPWYRQDDDAWRHALLRLMDGERFDLVLPATEAAVYALQSNHAVFSREPSVFLLENRAFQVVSDKRRTYELAKTLGVPIPTTKTISPEDRLDEVLADIRLPAIVKPCSSVRDCGSIDKHYVRQVDTRDELLAYLEYLFRQGAGVLLQEHCPGEGVGVELLADRGRILTAFAHRRLHETTGHGSTYRESIGVDDALLEAAARLMWALNYTGVAMVEFRVDPESGDWRLLEINGRFWGSLPLAAAAGADFPYYLYQLLVEGRRQFPQHFQTGVRCRNLLNDLRWTWRTLRGKGADFRNENAGSLGWKVNPLSRRRAIIDALRCLAWQDHLDTFCWDDPLPAVFEGVDVCKTVGSRVVRPRPKPVEIMPAVNSHPLLAKPRVAS